MPPRLLRQLLLLEFAGFGLVILIIWADELVDLPRLLFHAAPTPVRYEEALLESAAVLLLGLLTMALTRRLLRRLSYLESFVVLCAWCHRVQAGGEWIALERFLSAQRTAATHGICPECETRVEAG